VSLHEQIGASIRPTLWMLMAGVGLLVVLTAANLSSLSMARLVSRGRELATRIALGAGRRQLIRQLITENVLLAVFSGAIGLGGAALILNALPSLLPADFPRLAEIHLSGLVVVLLLLGSIVSGILVAGAPVFLMYRVDTQAVLTEGGRSGIGGVRHTRLRGLMISSQVAIAVTLLIGGALLVKSLRQVQHVDPGFNTKNLLVMQLSVPVSAYPSPDALRLFYPDLRRRLESLPGVRSVSLSVNVPFGRSRTGWGLNIEGKVVPPGQEDPGAGYHNGSESYFRTMGIALQRGRNFDATDVATSPLTAVISDQFAAENWPNEDPLGKRFRAAASDRPWITVIGVVGAVRHYALERDPQPEFYMCDCQETSRVVYLVARTDGDAVRVAPSIRAEIAAQSKAIAVYGVTTMDDMIGHSLTDRRIGAFLVALLAISALVLTSLGLYAALSHTVAQRTREIGVRMAMGAQTKDVMRLIVGQGMKVVSIGVAIGLAGALALAKVMKHFLFEVSAADPIVFAGVAILLVVVALLACWIPARRAAKVDPMIALRAE
jgi:putative ABC transport system permease protein